MTPFSQGGHRQQMYNIIFRCFMKGVAKCVRDEAIQRLNYLVCSYTCEAITQRVVSLYLIRCSIPVTMQCVGWEHLISILLVSVGPAC